MWHSLLVAGWASWEYTKIEVEELRRKISRPQAYSPSYHLVYYLRTFSFFGAYPDIVFFSSHFLYFFICIRHAMLETVPLP
jgi:hypothetical protein